MKRYLLILFLSLMVLKSQSQVLYNNGALVAIKSGGIVQINGSAENAAAGSFNNDGNTTITGNFTNNATADGNGTYTLAGNWINNSTFTPGTGTVIFNGTTPQTIGGTAVTTFNNLTVNNTGGGVSLSNVGAGINNTLTLTTGNFNVSTQILTLNNSATAVAGSPFSANNMVIANQGGELRKNYTALGTYLFPVGDNSGTAEYSPITVNVTAGSGFSSSYVGIKVNDVKHPDNHSTTHYLRRYWSVTQAGITACAASITGNYVTADIAGTETSIKSAQLNGVFNQISNPWLKYTFLGSNTLTATGVTLTPGTTSAFTGITGDDPSVSISGGGVTVCQGDNVTLTAVPANADPSVVYAWSGGLGSNVSVTPPTATTGTTTYTVTLTDGNGINATATTSVTVNASVGTPVFALGTASSRCQGADTVTYVATAANNTGITYSLDSASLSAGNIIDTATGKVTYTAGWTGISTVTATASGCSGPASAQHTVTITTGAAVSIMVTPNPSGPVCQGTPVSFTATPVNGGAAPVFTWYLNGSVVGSNSSAYSNSGLATGDAIYCRIASNQACISNNPAYSDTITMTVQPSLTAEINVIALSNPACTHTLVNFTATVVNGGTTPAYQWFLNSSPVTGANSNTYSNNSLSTGNTIYCRLTSNANCVIDNIVFSDTTTMVVSPIPLVNAGNDVTCYGNAVQIGDPGNGPGTISWLPAAGLNNPAIGDPLASPPITITYTITVNNNGCVRTDDVTVAFGGTGHDISGKTRYLAKANAGYPAPNLPIYNSVKYNINRVIVKLKTYPAGAELARDTSDATGVYQFTNIMDGNYMLSYDKYVADTMQSGDHVNAVDVALLKYLIGHDTLIDPSKSFTAKHKRAADVDNNGTVNSIDVARITAKIGLPYNPVRNFPGGNWVALDTVVAVSGADLNVTLKTVCYGDYDASSSKYRDSATTWGMAKSLPDENIILRSDESIMINDPQYFEVPLRISTKMNELSALGLELSYPGKEYKLVSASMSNTGKTSGAIKINPSLEEIIAANNDLLVTDDQGIIRVVFATTDHFDVAADDELIRLGFQSLSDPGRGELEFNLNGTGLIANQYGEINEDAYLTMPKIFVQGDDTEAGFEFAGYPNPFSSDATLTYNIPENGTVKLNVYNAIGELVSELVNENQAGGNHSVVYMQKNLSYGMYTFKLEFAGLNKSKCMVLRMIH